MGIEIFVILMDIIGSFGGSKESSCEKIAWVELSEPILDGFWLVTVLDIIVLELYIANYFVGRFGLKDDHLKCRF